MFNNKISLFWSYRHNVIYCCSLEQHSVVWLHFLSVVSIICAWGRWRKIKLPINNSEFQRVVLCTVAAGLFEEIWRYTLRRTDNFFFMYWHAQIKENRPSGPEEPYWGTKAHKLQMASWTVSHAYKWLFVHVAAELLDPVCKQAAVHTGLPNSFHRKLQRKVI